MLAAQMGGSIMIRRTCAGAIILAAVGTAAYAGAFEDGMAAYQKKDFTTAAAKLHEAAAQGNANAQVALGFMYHDGEGVPRDVVRSYMWFSVALTQFDFASQDFASTAEARDITAKSMTADDIQHAHDMTEACVARHYQACD